MGAGAHAIDRRDGDRATPPGQIHVTVVDDHAMSRRVVRALIESGDGMELLADADEPDAVLEQLRRARPDVLVLSSGMTGGSCLEQVRRLRSLVPETQVVLTTMNPSRALADAALAAGAVGFVLKNRADSELCEAIRLAARGRHYRSAWLTQP